MSAASTPAEAAPADALPAARRYRSKTVATWLALLLGTFGAHRFYLHGARDVLAWLHPWPTLAGLGGLVRMQNLGTDDRWSWLLIPVFSFMLAQACLCAIVYGLTPDERWDARRNPGQPPRATRWAPVLAVIAAMMIGSIAMTSTIAMGVQRFFEWQLESPAPKG